MNPNWLHLTIENVDRVNKPIRLKWATVRHIPKSAEMSGRLKAQEPLIKFSINVKLGSQPKPISAGKIGFRRSALSKMWGRPARFCRSAADMASQLIQEVCADKVASLADCKGRQTCSTEPTQEAAVTAFVPVTTLGDNTIWSRRAGRLDR